MSLFFSMFLFFSNSLRRCLYSFQILENNFDGMCLVLSLKENPELDPKLTGWCELIDAVMLLLMELIFCKYRFLQMSRYTHFIKIEYRPA